MNAVLFLLPGPSKFVLAGLKSDLLADPDMVARQQERNDGPITEEEILRLASILDAPYFEVSAMQNKGVCDCRELWFRFSR